MPQMGLGKQAAISGLLQGLIGGYGQSQQRQIEQEVQSRKDSLAALKDQHKWAKEVYGEKSPEVATLARQIVGIYEGSTGAPGGGQQVLQPRDLPAQRPLRRFSPSGVESGLQMAGQGAQAAVEAGKEREERAAKRQADAAKRQATSALRARLKKLYDDEKKKLTGIDVEIAGLEMTMPEPKKEIMGMFGNQAERDSHQANIDTLKQYRAKIQSNMDRVVREGRRRFGEDIIFGIPGKDTTAVTTPGEMSKMSTEEILRDMLKTTEE